MKEIIDKFVGICDKGNNNIEDFVKDKSVDEKIELRACLKEKITHSEKTNIIVFEGSICVAILTLQITLWILPMLLLIVIWLCVEQNKKAKYTKALSYLEDYWNEENQKEMNRDSSGLETETCEQMRERFVKDIDKKIFALNEKRIEIDEEISWCDEFRNTLNKFGEHD